MTEPTAPTDDGPPSRVERQERTREALIAAAQSVFARDGYSGARLDAIAREAGYSKGAVYSNFDGKADLFLAVMDTHLAMIDQLAWDPFGPPLPAERTATEFRHEDAARGFALATLEFVAAAARDEELLGRLRDRIGALFTGFGAVSARRRDHDDPLTPDQIASLQVALDQGSALLILTGYEVSPELVREGLQRLGSPRRVLEQRDEG